MTIFVSGKTDPWDNFSGTTLAASVQKRGNVQAIKCTKFEVTVHSVLET